LPVGGSPKRYVSTDPRDWDTDKDGMDDYYELFHGLNPILGNGSRSDGLDDRVGLAYTENGAWIINWMHNDWYITTDAYAMDMDFVRYPWLAGMPSADPDADGLLNLEEALRPDTADPQNYNTDPSPIWMTDRSSPQSVVSRFYYFGGDMFFWPGTNVEISDLNAREPFMMFSFEENEGYDTDNDGVCDKIEMSKSATASSSPLDHDDPVRRQALWFDGAQSAAQTLRREYRGEWALRSFTVELWACPETVETAEGQVLIERPIKYLPSDVSTPGGTMRRNFRIGIEPDGRVYAMFDNAGAHDEQTGFTRVEGRKLLPNQWVHLAASMDGANGKFSLLVTHPRVSADEPLTYETYSEGTDKVPANGILTVVEDQPGTNTAVTITHMSAPIVLGAALNDMAIEGPDGWPYIMLLSASWAEYSDFFRGYIDEVRVWDGARTEDQIRESRSKRFNRTDLLANRLAVRKAEYSGASRMPGSSIPLPAELMYHYTFDNLFGADRPESVAKVPRGFNHPDTADNRPAGYEVGWWSSIPVRSAVYDDYGYVPWIENGMAHLPLFSRKGLDTDELYPFVDMVLNSVFWSHTKAGDISKPDYKLYHFPNDNNPYGMWYEHYTGVLSLPSSGDSVVRNSGDLLPLGNAFARRAANFWDADDPGSVWAETGDDEDADGLPDWWEGIVETNRYPGVDLAWNDLYPDGSGMTAGERYLRDLADGWQMGDTTAPTGLRETADIDRDGLPDWWENLYNLKVESQADAETAMYSQHGGMGDPDRDGLSSYAEYLISEHYAFKRLSPVMFRSSLTQTSSDYFLKEGSLYFGQMFTDHDFMEDSWEDNYHPYYVSRFVYDAHLDYDGDGWSNWAECRFGGTTLRSDPSLVMHDSPEEFLIKDFPVPLINARLRYDGLHREANTVVIHAFSDPDMNGQPDAVFTTGEGEAKAKYLGLWGPKSVRGVLSPGAVKPGSVRVRFTDNTPRPATTRLGYYWSVEARSVEAGSDSSDPASGDDRNGFIRIMNDNGMTETVGTINYLTGEYEIDFAVIQGWVLGSFAYDGGVMVAPERDVNDAYIVISYEAAEMPGWPKNLYLSDADLPSAAQPSLGYVKEGFNYFFAFLDLDRSGQWSAGEPCGVSESFAVDVGWDRQTVNIYLTDYRPGFLRIDLNSGLRSEDIYLGGSSSGGGSSGEENTDPRVVIRRTHVDGFVAPEPYTVVDKTMTGMRSYLHEGDLIGRNQLGFDWALLGVSNPQQWNEFVYEVRRGASGELVSVFTNIYDTVRAKAVATYPANAYVYSARPEFRWRMPAGYTAFAIEIKKSSPAGATVYSAEPVLAPARNSYGEHIWRAPIYAGAPLQNGQVFTTDTVYYWRVMALNSKFSNTALNPNWSDWKSFRLDVNRPIDSSGYGEIRARVKYYGPATSLLAGRVKVRVFDNEGFAGWPEAEYTLAGSDLTSLTSGNEPVVNAVMRGLVPSEHAGNYYVMAYIDHNQNGDRDIWESWGYANHYGLTDKPYDPRAVKVAFGRDSEVVDIVIEDADTDQDWFPDAWEYEANPGAANFLTLTGPATGSAPDTEINPALSAAGPNAAAFFLTMSAGTTDQDGDGLGDLLELALGTDAAAPSSSGDGYRDGDKLALGFDPNAFLTLNLTGLDLVSENAPAVSFDFGLEQPETEGSALLPRLAAMSTAATRDYEILYKQSLSDADWTVVQRGSVPVSGLESVSVRLEDAVLQNLNPEIGFFRIRLAHQ
ncbi:MAG: hypothetical protein PHE10_02895, partial [Kiritimatiellae bacterium]|nr:hypothetical protein [Kiritimatiellia bacterium]